MKEVVEEFKLELQTDDAGGFLTKLVEKTISTRRGSYLAALERSDTDRLSSICN
jgi:hypothetical protein